MQAISEILGPIVDGAKPVPKATESVTDGVFRSLVEVEDRAEAIDAPELAEIEVDLSGDEPDKANDPTVADAPDDPENISPRTAESATDSDRENVESSDLRVKPIEADNARSALFGILDKGDALPRESAARNDKVDQMRGNSSPAPVPAPDIAATSKAPAKTDPLPAVRPQAFEPAPLDRKVEAVAKAGARPNPVDPNSANMTNVSKQDHQNAKVLPERSAAAVPGDGYAKPGADISKQAASSPSRGAPAVETQRPQPTGVDVRAATPSKNAVPSERGTGSGAAQPQVTPALQNANTQPATRSILTDPATQSGTPEKPSRPDVAASPNDRSAGPSKEPTVAVPPALAKTNLTSGGAVTGSTQQDPQAKTPRLPDVSPAEPAKPDRSIQSPSPAQQQPQSMATAQPVAAPVAQVNVAANDRFVRRTQEPRLEDTGQTARREPAATAPTRAPVAAHMVAKEAIALAAEGQRQNNIASIKAASGFTGPLGIDAEDGAFALGSNSATGPQTSVPVSAMPPSGGAQVAQHIARQLAMGITPLPDGAIEIQLSPEELGRVRLVVNTADGNLMLAVQAERPETADLMRRHIETLMKEFREMGYQNTGFSFEGQSGNNSGSNSAKGSAPSDGNVGPAVADPVTNVSGQNIPKNQSTTTGLDLRF